MTYRMLFSWMLAVAVTSGALATAAEHTKESLTEIKEQVDGGKGVLVDVREIQEWDAGHIDGAIFFPISSVTDGLTDEELKKLPKDKSLYIHCIVGMRALKVAKVLEQKGFLVRPLKPGYDELVEAGFPKAP